MAWNDIKSSDMGAKGRGKKAAEEKREPYRMPVGDELTADDVQPLTDLEASYMGDMEAYRESFAAKLKAEAKRVKDVTDAGYYFIVCFKNREQLNECCAALDVDSTRLYHSGAEVMRGIKRCQRVPDPEFPLVRPYDKDFMSLVMTDEDIDAAYRAVEDTEEQE